MKPRAIRSPVTLALAGSALSLVLALACAEPEPSAPSSLDRALDRERPNRGLLRTGREIFRFDTFGNETFWTDTLGLHLKIRSAVSPTLALAVGLKVDVEALPDVVRSGLLAGTIDLDDPATTVALLELGAVLGVVGEVDDSKTLTRIGITCAFCHSTVDNSFAPGIGRRLDGWPNRDLDVGRIVALSDALTPAQRAVYSSWGPGLYDPRFNIDGQNHPVVIPPAFGLRRIAREIYTGDGPVSYWNAYVAITQMHGHGNFSDPRIGVVRNNPPDLVSSKLDALRAYQFSLGTPRPKRGEVERAAARRGRAVFRGPAGCNACHLEGGRGSDVNRGVLHDPVEVGQDPAYALRSATKRYRTTPLRGLWRPPQLTGPYFHDGSAATLEQVVEHYVALFDLKLTAQQKADLVAYLRTL